MTPQEYLEIEREAEFRSEYVDGRAYAIPPNSRNHSWVIANTVGTLGEQLRGKRCGATSSNMRLYSEEFGIYTYPDIVVTCPPEKFLDNHKDTITDAVVVVEVLSPRQETTIAAKNSGSTAHCRRWPNICFLPRIRSLQNTT